MAFSNAQFGPGTGDIFLDNVACTGTQLFLFNCSHNGIGVHNCIHAEDASIRCINTTISKSCTFKLVVILFSASIHVLKAQELPRMAGVIQVF